MRNNDDRSSIATGANDIEENPYSTIIKQLKHENTEERIRETRLLRARRSMNG